MKIRNGRTQDNRVQHLGAWVKDCLLLFDPGHYNFHHYNFRAFSSIAHSGGFFVIRLKDGANPEVTEVIEGASASVVRAGARLADVLASTKQDRLDLRCRITFRRRAWTGRRHGTAGAFRIVAIRNPETFCMYVYITNIEAERLAPKDIAAVYAGRWAIELFVNELKSQYRIHDLPSSKLHVVEALILAALLTLLRSPPACMAAPAASLPACSTTAARTLGPRLRRGRSHARCAHLLAENHDRFVRGMMRESLRGHMDGITLTVVVAGAVPVRHYFVGPRVRLGREAGNDLVLADAQVSRSHLEIRLRGGRWTVADLGSRHGSSINGRPLLGEERIDTGDELRLGSCTVLAQIPSRAGARPPHALETGDGPVVDVASSIGATRLIGSSAAMRRIRDRIRAFAESPMTVLLRGEPGTGKEVAARLLHEWSPRADGPFIVFNCPAHSSSMFDAALFGVETGAAMGVLPRPGMVRLAAGGTLFLDEIGELDVSVQAKLLRFLQDKRIDTVGASGAAGAPVDVRIVAATNRNLEAEVRAGRFRADLYQRMEHTQVEMPPLRDRREDVPELVQWFCRLARPAPAGVSDEALAEICRRPHAGNVRALEGSIQAAAVNARGGLIEPGHLEPNRDGASADPAEELQARLMSADGDFERDCAKPFLARKLDKDVLQVMFRRLLAEHGTRTAIATALRINKFRLMNFLNKHGLNPAKS